MDLETRRALLQRYREGPAVVAAALAGATDAELDARPADGGWTAREVAIHLPDSEINGAVRLRRLVAEDEPHIIGYDQERWAERLYYNRPIAAALAALTAIRGLNAELLDALTEEEWQRAGTHSESGRYGLDTWLPTYAAHAHDHADQIRRALAEARDQAVAVPA
ncbi:MAG: DinB family protein [Chloroflexi bacterium]|nr:DinB family protein [Chloroflexota bacterium]